jgi:hypothetical protein
MGFWSFRQNEVIARLIRIETKLNQLLAGQATGKAMLMTEQEELANLVQRVAENHDAVASATAALEGLLARVATLSKELQDAIAAGGDVSPDIKAAADQIQANTAALQDAVPHIAHAIMQGTETAP